MIIVSSNFSAVSLVSPKLQNDNTCYQQLMVGRTNINVSLVIVLVIRN